MTGNFPEHYKLVRRTARAGAKTSGFSLKFRLIPADTSEELDSTHYTAMQRLQTIRSTGRAGFTLVEIMIVVAIIGLLAAIAIPNFVRARTTSQKNACINNLRLIDAAKQQWALESHVRRAPPCPQPRTCSLISATARPANCPPVLPIPDTNPPSPRAIHIRNIGTKPTCKQVASTHVLP